MDLEMDVTSAVAMIESWFKKHCNGTWEHHLGITIETSDNPGWVLTFRELRIARAALADIIGDLLRQFDSQVATDGSSVRVYAPTLSGVLVAGAILTKWAEDAEE